MSPETNHSVIPRPSQGISSAIENSWDLIFVHLPAKTALSILTTFQYYEIANETTSSFILFLNDVYDSINCNQSSKMRGNP